MAVWNTGTHPPAPSISPYISQLTQQYHEIQRQNLLTFQRELLRSTNPLGLGLDLQEKAIVSQIDGMPPGRPLSMLPREYMTEKPQVAMSYAEHRRLKEMAENPEGYAAALSSMSDNQHSRGGDDDGWEKSSVGRYDSRGAGRGSRGGYSGGRSDRGGNSFYKRSNEKASSGWEGEDDKPVNKQFKSQPDDDGWDSVPEKKSNGATSSAPAVDDDWDSFMPEPSNKKVASSGNYEGRPSSSTAAVKNNDDWDDAPVPVAAKRQSQSKDDWSDDEKPASSSYRQESSSHSNGYRGRGSNNYRGNSRSRESSSFSREGSSDRYRSASRSSNRSDGSNGYDRPPRSSSYSSSGPRPPRQSRPDDWNCPSCSCKGNFGNRNECFKCGAAKPENPMNDDGPSAPCTSRPPRQPRPDDWDCASCSFTGNFGSRYECFKCGASRPEDSSSGGNSGSSSYRDSRGSSRGFGGGRRGGSSGSGGRQSYSSTPAASSGWSDGEDEKPKKAPVAMTGGDDWDTDKSPVKKAPKVQVGGDDDWDSISAPITAPLAPAKSNSKDEDDWESLVVPAKAASKAKNDNVDEWDVPDMTGSKPRPSPKRKLEEDDEWDSFKAPAKVPKVSADGESSWDVDKAKGEETLDEPSSSTIDDDVAVKVSDANDDDSWETGDKSAGATNKAASVAVNDDENW